MKLYFNIFLIIIIFNFYNLSLLSQDEKINEEKELRLHYISSISGEIFKHSAGYGIGFHYGKFYKGNSQKFLSIQLLNFKHEKEYKTRDYLSSNSSGYFYGKKNSFFVLRSSMITNNFLFEKESLKGVSIGLNYGLGLNLGFLKPVYLKITYDHDGNLISSARKYSYIKEEAFDINRHNPDYILGKSAFTKGLIESRLLFGIHAKAGIAFEFAKHDAIIQMIEIGSSFDIFHKKVEIMDIAKNKSYFLTLYISYYFGKKTLY